MIQHIWRRDLVLALPCDAPGGDTPDSYDCTTLKNNSTTLGSKCVPECSWM